MTKIAILAAVGLIAGAAHAQRPGGFGRGGPMLSPAAQALDTDRDGVVSASEMEAAAASLKTLDKNGDGKLTSDEVRPQMGGRGGEGPGETAGPDAEELVKTLMAFDKNGDGQLAKDEVPERMQGMFERADGDRNGVLSAEEIRKSAQAASGSGRGRGEGRGEGRGPGGPPDLMRMDPVLASLDTDSNGEISAAEMAAAPTALKKLDRNGDGRLTADEAGMNFARSRGGFGGR